MQVRITERGKNTRITRGIRVAILLYGIWWLFALVFEILGASQAVRMITGSDSREVIENATRYLQVSIPMMPPMGVLIIVRNALPRECGIHWLRCFAVHWS